MANVKVVCVFFLFTREMSQEQVQSQIRRRKMCVDLKFDLSWKGQIEKFLFSQLFFCSQQVFCTTRICNLMRKYQDWKIPKGGLTYLAKTLTWKKKNKANGQSN